MYDQVTLKLNVDPWILSALKEDITSEDVSTNSVMPHTQAGEEDLIEPLCFSGTVVLAYKANHGLMNSVHGDVDKVFNAGSRTASCHDYRSKGVDG